MWCRPMLAFDNGTLDQVYFNRRHSARQPIPTDASILDTESLLRELKVLSVAYNLNTPEYQAKSTVAFKRICIPHQ